MISMLNCRFANNFAIGGSGQTGFTGYSGGGGDALGGAVHITNTVLRLLAVTFTNNASRRCDCLP